MKKLHKMLILLFIIYGITSIIQPLENNWPKDQKTHNFRILVKFKTGVFSKFNLIEPVSNINSEKLIKLFQDFHVRTIRKALSNRYHSDGSLKPYQTESGDNELESWHLLTLRNQADAFEFIKKIKKQKEVITALIEYPLQILPHISPNDPEFTAHNQWGLENTASQSTDIDAVQAWDINRGRNDVIIAVCDGGVDYTHSDLDPGDRSRVIAGIDTGDNDNDPMDDLPGTDPESYATHGTKVAGVIGARTNNSNEVAGVMWNCKIMPVKMVGSGSVTFIYPGGQFNWDFSTTAFPSDVADAIDYATNNGASVINLSYGFPSYGLLLDQIALRVPLLLASIKNAYNNNVVIVGTMGNEYNDGNPIEYPGAFHEVIAVGASTSSGVRASFSNTGNHISVVAPGQSILTTTRGGGTTYASGTSLAAPFVSGTAGLIISEAKDRNISITNDDVRHILERTANDISPSGWDNATGFGKINANNALTLINIPNQLYHYTSTGGTSTFMTTLSSWIYVGDKWGLAAGTYYQVDRYKITKHVSYDIPFCSSPSLWMRERESVCMSAANPNDGYPFVNITNFTNTGFDLEYYVYYVRYNVLGQTINKWIPSTAASSKLVYTVVGNPNITATAGNITGSFIICTSNKTYSLTSVPSGCTLTWSNSSNLQYVSGQGTNSYVVKAPSASTFGNGTVSVTISSPQSCSSTIRSMNVWVGKFESTVVTGQAAVCPDTYYTYTANVPGGHSSSYTYYWTYPSNWLYPSQYQNTLYIKTPMYNPQYGTVRVSINNACGTSGYSGITVYPNPSCGYYFTYSPNPVADVLTVEAVAEFDNLTNSAVEIPDEIPFNVVLYNTEEQIVDKGMSNGRKAEINVSKLSAGQYFLHIIYCDKIIKEQIIIK